MKPMIVALLTSLALGASASAQEDCNGCNRGCPLEIPGLWISSVGNDILDWDGGDWCEYDPELTCCDLIQCPGSFSCETFADDMIAAVRDVRDEHALIAFMRGRGQPFKLLPDRQAVAVYGCNNSLAALLPTKARLITAYAFTPQREKSAEPAIKSYSGVATRLPQR